MKERKPPERGVFFLCGEEEMRGTNVKNVYISKVG